MPQLDSLLECAHQAEDTGPSGAAAQVASARCVWLACLAVVVGLGPNRGLTEGFLGKTSTTKLLLDVVHYNNNKSCPNQPGSRARLFFSFIYLFVYFINSIH